MAELNKTEASASVAATATVAEGTKTEELQLTKEERRRDWRKKKNQTEGREGRTKRLAKRRR